MKNMKMFRQLSDPAALFPVILIFVLIHFHCYINEPSPLNGDNHVSITGTIFEKIENDISPGKNTTVFLYIPEDTLETVTDNNGTFEFIIGDTIQTVQLYIAKNTFTKIDTMIQVSGDTVLEFTLDRLICYLPFVENNQWTYNSAGSRQSMQFLERTEGMEKWTLIAYDEVQLKGIMQTQFEGRVYELEYIDDAWDTLDVEDVAVETNRFFEIIDNSIVFSAANPPVTINSNLIYGTTGERIFTVYYPDDTPEIVDMSDGFKFYREFQIEKNVGFKNMIIADHHIFGTHSHRLELVGFSF